MSLLQVDIDPDQHKALRILAVQQDTSIAEIIRSAVAAILLEQGK